MHNRRPIDDAPNRVVEFIGMSDLREALLLADEDIKTNWRRYKDRFLRGRQG